jgi:hypothetical protein
MSEVDETAREPDESEIDEIEQERERRLDPDNRPENAEVDNTDATLPTVEEFERQSADEETEGSAGTADPSEAFREIQPSDEEVKEIEEERERRLAPENRPENAVVDNTSHREPDED